MALKHGQKLSDLKSIDAQDGSLEWIGIRTQKRGNIEPLEQVELVSDTGLAGDHRANKSGSKRQVTIVQYEHLTVIASLLGKKQISPECLRRNLLISKLNILTLKNEVFSIGDTLLEGTGHCHPCSRMEEHFGPGGYNAVRGHGGITAKILQGGMIRIGDKVKRRPN